MLPLRLAGGDTGSEASSVRGGTGVFGTTSDLGTSSA